MTVKEKIIGTLRATGRENIEQVIEYMENNGFFTKSCHRHHHYRGGLADHAWQTYQIALQNNPNGIDEQSIAICALLHDFCNCGGMTDQVGHGRRSAGMLKELRLHLSHDEFCTPIFPTISITTRGTVLCVASSTPPTPNLPKNAQVQSFLPLTIDRFG